MNVGTEDRKKLAILGVAGVGALAAGAYIYTQLFPSAAPVSTTSPAVAAPPAATRAASAPPGESEVAGPGVGRKLATTTASLDPTLHMSAMLTTESLLYRGSGRNIFSANAETAAVNIPKPVSSARPSLTAAVSTQPTGPVGPPPINLRFFGTATRPNQPPRAFLLRGEDVVLASVGDIVQRRYKILSIAATSITVEDLSDEHQQTLPLLAN